MDENNVNTNDAVDKSSSKQSFGSKLSSGISKANQLKHDYQNAGGLTGMAKNAINDKIHDKIGSKVDAAKAKAKDKIDDKKDALKGKINDKLPDSVKQKKAQMDAKKKVIQDKINAPKDKLDNMKQQLDDKKKKINETAFKKTAKTVADSVAPGSGIAAEKMLESKKGQPALDAARNASNPVSAVKEGTKKLVQIIVSNKIKQKLAISLIPVFIFIFMIIIVVLAISSKFNDSQTYFKGDPYQEGTGSADVSKLDKKYEQFYQYVEKYSSNYSADKAMIIAVLTAYDDNDKYSDLDTESSAIDGESGTDTIPDDSTISKLSKSRMKKYIKKVAKKLQDVQNVITEGDYENKESGSDFFWWLMDDFVGDYYADYLGKSENVVDKKKEIVRFIYLYYKDLSTGSGATCTVGGEEVRYTTYTGNGLGSGVSLSELTTDEKGFYYYEKDGKKYLVIATATNICIDSKTVCGYTNATDKIPNHTRYPYITYYNYFDTMVLNIDGKTYDAMVLDSCGACQWEQSVRGDRTHQRIDIFITKDAVAPTSNDYGTIVSSSGTCQIAGNQVRLGDEGLYAESIMPIANMDSDLYVSAGYYGYKKKNGNWHGSEDISCKKGGTNCYKYTIISAHEGKVIEIHNQNYNGYSQEAGNKTNTPYKAESPGKQIWIEITDGEYKGYTYIYAHLSEIDSKIKFGSIVKKGQILGQMGNTGMATGPHLHFELRDPNGLSVNIDQFVARNLPKG